MDALSTIGPALLAVAALVTAVSTWLNRRDTRDTNEKTQELAASAQGAQELKLAWDLYKENFDHQEKRLAAAESRQSMAEGRQQVAEERVELAGGDAL